MIQSSHSHRQAAEQILAHLATRPRILIVSHPNPDGDSMGSSLALMHMFRKMGLDACCLVPNTYPSFLSWMPGIQEMTIFDRQKKKALSLIHESELVICVDFNSFRRLADYDGLSEVSQKPSVLIDHHLEPDEGFLIRFHTHEVSSTCELIYELFVLMGVADLIDLPVAECLYVGIMTDTGSYSYSCNYVRTYTITADLMRLGIDAQHIHNLVYDTFSEWRMRLLGHMLHNCMVVIPEYHTAYMYLSLIDQKSFHFQSGDSEGFVNYALSISGIRFAAFFTEKTDKVRISLRSKGSFSVNMLARKHFEGGGHKNAAGANSYKSLTETLKYFESILPEYKEDLCRQD